MINRNTLNIEANEFQLSTHSLRKKRGVDIPEELLMVQTIKIKDKFGFRAQTQAQENAINRNEFFNTETNTVSFHEKKSIITVIH